MNSWPRKWVILWPLGRLEHREAVTSPSRAQSCVGSQTRGVVHLPLWVSGIICDYKCHWWQTQVPPSLGRGCSALAPSHSLFPAHFKCSAPGKEGLPSTLCCPDTSYCFQPSKTKQAKPSPKTNQIKNKTHQKTKRQKKKPTGKKKKRKKK